MAFIEVLLCITITSPKLGPAKVCRSMLMLIGREVMLICIGEC